MASTYHSGERAVQTRAGVPEQADRVGGGIRATIPAAAADFLAMQPLVILAAVAGERIWASPLFGRPGFAHALDECTLRIAAAPVPGDPIAAGLDPRAAVGLLAIDPGARRRMRVNGSIRARNQDGFEIATSQVYANCPKYIQARDLDGVSASPSIPLARRSAALTPAQAAWVEAADTFFIGTSHRDAGADASHRGGHPGFVRVDSPSTLVFPDYAGNTMFQTLGNLELDPRAGLLFLDFARGATLQLSGHARVDWDPAAAAAFPGAQRVVALTIDAVVEIDAATPFRWRFASFSPFNPR